MTKILTKKETCERLGRMNITVVLGDAHGGSVRSVEKHFGANEVLNCKWGRGSDRDGSDFPERSIEYINEAMASMMDSVRTPSRRGDFEGKSIANRLKQNIFELINVYSRGIRH